MLENLMERKSRMRYVIVSVVHGEAGDANNKLRSEVKKVFGAKSSTLPAHFTIKAPFEYDGDIDELKSRLRAFVQEEKAESYRIQGYDHFDRRVIYMDVVLTKEAKAVHDRLIDILEQFDYISCNQKDGKDKTFHVTVASKRIGPIYDELWEYVQKIPCDYDCQFDNVTLYRWGDRKWEVEEKFIFH